MWALSTDQVRTECLLVEGCDDRITVPYDAGKTTNKYHCSPVPTPEVVSRSSCTSSSSSRYVLCVNNSGLEAIFSPAANADVAFRMARGEELASAPQNDCSRVGCCRFGPRFTSSGLRAAGGFVALRRRAFDSADCARHDLLLSWALKKGVGRDQGREESSQGLYDDGCFTNRMSDIRRRLLDVLGLHRKDVEVGVRN